MWSTYQLTKYTQLITNQTNLNMSCLCAFILILTLLSERHVLLIYKMVLNNVHRCLRLLHSTICEIFISLRCLYYGLLSLMEKNFGPTNLFYLNVKLNYRASFIVNVLWPCKNISNAVRYTSYLLSMYTLSQKWCHSTWNSLIPIMLVWLMMWGFFSSWWFICDSYVLLPGNTCLLCGFVHFPFTESIRVRIHK